MNKIEIKIDITTSPPSPQKKTIFLKILSFKKKRERKKKDKGFLLKS